MPAESKKIDIQYQIEILRGISVLLVLLFHLGFFLLPSGYLGVDVFFVISGYLMALLYGKMASGADVWTFYKKRLNRLLPAYFAVLFITILACALILLPLEFGDTQRYGLYSALLLPNIGFWLDASYFDTSFFKAFLNLWSLGVELQFYLVFPLIAYLSRRSTWLAVGITLLSLAACIFMTGISPKTSFFMMPLRIWEFMAGALLVFYTSRSTAHGALGNISARICATVKPYKEILAVAALVAIVVCAAIPLGEYDHPKWAALVECALAMFVISAGVPVAFIKSPAGRGLLILGTYSYSIYLVHFPIIALIKYKPFGGFFAGTLSPLQIALALVLTGICSFALYHLVEIPLRRGFLGRFNMWTYIATSILIIVSLPILSSLNESRYTPEIRIILSAWTDRAPYRCPKISRILYPFDQTCTVTQGPESAKRYLLVGNSHADAIKGALGKAAIDHGATLRMMVQNCALGEGVCAPESIRSIVRTEAISTVIVHSRADVVNPDALSALVTMGETDGFNVAFIDPVPVWNVNVIQSLYDAQTIGAPLPTQTIKDYESANAQIFKKISVISSNRFARYETATYLCAPDCRLTDGGGQPLYFDSGHLTLTGARQLMPVFEQIFSK